MARGKQLLICSGIVGSKHRNYNGSSSNMPAGTSNRSIFNDRHTSSHNTRIPAKCVPMVPCSLLRS